MAPGTKTVIETKYRDVPRQRMVPKQMVVPRQRVVSKERIETRYKMVSLLDYLRKR